MSLLIVPSSNWNNGETLSEPSVTSAMRNPNYVGMTTERTVVMWNNDYQDDDM